jgi:hypothetical protein
MKELRILILLICLVALFGCTDSGNNFSLDLNDLSSTENTGDRDFGIYIWELSDNAVAVVVPYKEYIKDALYDGNASIDIEIDGEDLHFTTDEYDFASADDLYFITESFDCGNNLVSVDLEYYEGWFSSRDYSVNIPATEKLTDFRYSDDISTGTRMTFDWDISANSDYQLLTAEQSNSLWISDYFSKRVSGTKRTYRFPSSHKVDLTVSNHYSLTQVNQIAMSKVMGLHFRTRSINIGLGLKSDKADIDILKEHISKVLPYINK